MSKFISLYKSQNGAAGAEMALIVPLLVTLMFGSFELGNYFWNEHKVVKGVRDASRYASRQSFTKFSCAAVTDSAVLAQIKNVARTGQVSGGTAKVYDWVDSDVTVSVTCASGTQTGIYKGMAGGAPLVTVSAAVGYTSLFEVLGFDSSDLTLNAASQKRGDGYMKRTPSFVQDVSGGPAAEFALVLPLALLFLFGIIDVGRFMWEYNRAEKATQMGARFAAVTDMVPTTLASTSFVAGTVTQGDTVPLSSFAGTRCISGACNTTPTNACPTGTVAGGTNWGYASTAFTNIVNRISAIKPDVTAANVVIDYANAGLGFAGDPNGSDVAPLITVRLCNMQFSPITTQIFGINTAMPDFSYSLTAEDGVGSTSN